MRFKIDTSLGGTVAGVLGGVALYRFVLRPALHRDAAQPSVPPHAADALEPPPAPPRVAAAAPPSVDTSSLSPLTPATRGPAALPKIQQLDSLATLDAIAHGVSVLLLARGYEPAKAEAARAAFTAAAAQLARAGRTESLRFYVIDDNSAPKPAELLTTRLGIAAEQPFVMVLDRFSTTEHKYLAKSAPVGRPPSAAEMAAFVGDFLEGRLSPMLLGQERPPGDRNPRCPALVEVVTSSFDELVLDPRKDVFLEAYTPKCDACKAFAPRLRMFARLAADHLPWLRVASMNILDNDRPIQYVPEKWTPSMHVFPAAAPGQSTKTESALLDWDAEGGAFATPRRAIPVALPLKAGDGGSSSFARPGAGGSGADANNKKLVLPSLPELVTFALTHSSRGMPAEGLPPALAAAAEEMEQEAMLLEQAYSQCLQYMEVWHTFVEITTELEEAGEVEAATPGEGEVAAAARARGQQMVAAAAHQRDVADALRAKIVTAYRFVLEEAGARPDAGAAQAVDLLEEVAALLQKESVLGRIAMAAVGEKVA